MRCDRCGTTDGSFWIGGSEFGYKNSICFDCYKELEEQRDIKSVEQLEEDNIIHSLNPEQTVKNFIKYFVEYQKEPNAKLLDILWRIMCWASHADHTASCTIHEICKWQKFDFCTEFDKYKGD